MCTSKRYVQSCSYGVPKQYHMMHRLPMCTLRLSTHGHTKRPPLFGSTNCATEVCMLRTCRSAAHNSTLQFVYAHATLLFACAHVHYRLSMLSTVPFVYAHATLYCRLHYAAACVLRYIAACICSCYIGALHCIVTFICKSRL